MSHEEKFAGLIAAITRAKAEGAQTLMVSSPGTLGDDYDELVENLKRVGEAGLALRVVQPGKRSQADPCRRP
jgi:hypothetical protein